jgi:DNA gyrase subunit B
VRTDGTEVSGDALVAEGRAAGNLASLIGMADTEIGLLALTKALAVTGAWDAEVFASEDNKQAAVDFLCRIMPQRMASPGTRWTGETLPQGYRLSWTRKGVTNSATVRASLSENPIVQALLRHLGDFQQMYVEGLSDDPEPVILPASMLRIGGKEVFLQSPSDLNGALLERGYQGVKIKRFKGLGEMNPDQLKDTTLDPPRRSLLQLRVDDPATADDVLSVLLGDEVAPRKEFILSHAQSATLDI